MKMNKTLEYSFDVGVALLATVLQVQWRLPVFDMYSVGLKLAVFAGAASYVFKAKRDEKLSFQDAIFTAFTGYTCGVYLAPAIVKYYGLGEPEYVGVTHYAAGGMGMWLMNIGWALMKGAHQDAWPMLKAKIFGKKGNGTTTDS